MLSLGWVRTQCIFLLAQKFQIQITLNYMGQQRWHTAKHLKAVLNYNILTLVMLGKNWKYSHYNIKQMISDTTGKIIRTIWPIKYKIKFVSINQTNMMSEEDLGKDMCKWNQNWLHCSYHQVKRKKIFTILKNFQ